MFEILPAIDMKNHEVVRLSQGKMDDTVVYASNPVDMASHWIEKGTKRLHLVDLNGAFEGKPIHFEEVSLIAKKYPDVEIEIGGGIRSMETIQAYFDHGVTYCILGTAAIKNPALLREASNKYPGKIVLGVDAKDGRVATEGWDDVSSLSSIDLIMNFKDCELNAVIYTDISKDGMMKGMNLKSTLELAMQSPVPIIASGGLTHLEEITKLKEMKNVIGVIAGKSLYEKLFTLEEAIEAAG